MKKRKKYLEEEKELEKIKDLPAVTREEERLSWLQTSAPPRMLTGY